MKHMVDSTAHSTSSDLRSAHYTCLAAYAAFGSRPGVLQCALAASQSENVNFAPFLPIHASSAQRLSVYIVEAMGHL